MTYSPRNSNGSATSANSEPVVIASDQAALPLSTGAATSALQTTGNTSIASVDTKTPTLVSGRVPVDGSGVTQPVSIATNTPVGTVADAVTDSGNPVKIGGRYVATPATYTDGQRVDLQTDARGNVRVILQTGTTPISGTADNADGAAVTSTNANLAVRARNTIYNGTTWDRLYANWNTTTGDTGAKTTTFNGATQTNYNAGGVTIVIVVGTVSGTTPTLVAKLQGSADGGTTFYDIPGASTASITATGNSVLAVYPGITVAANAAVSYPLPRTWRVVYTIGGTTPSFALTSVQVAYTR